MLSFNQDLYKKFLKGGIKMFSRDEIIFVECLFASIIESGKNEITFTYDSMKSAILKLDKYFQNRNHKFKTIFLKNQTTGFHARFHGVIQYLVFSDKYQLITNKNDSKTLRFPFYQKEKIKKHCQKISLSEEDFKAIGKFF
ncbi:hypothetical protein C0583_03540 [Candidatus Parcubacteria bacterium]|nr:MAG: hypothetical protein C0583_03540 [Candidatus Parcubacteria bacterium]